MSLSYLISGVLVDMILDTDASKLILILSRCRTAVAAFKMSTRQADGVEPCSRQREHQTDWEVWIKTIYAPHGQECLGNNIFLACCIAMQILYIYIYSII